MPVYAVTVHTGCLHAAKALPVIPPHVCKKQKRFVTINVLHRQVSHRIKSQQAIDGYYRRMGRFYNHFFIQAVLTRQGQASRE